MLYAELIGFLYQTVFVIYMGIRGGEIEETFFLFVFVINILKGTFDSSLKLRMSFTLTHTHTRPFRFYSHAAIPDVQTLSSRNILNILNDHFNIFSRCAFGDCD